MRGFETFLINMSKKTKKQRHKIFKIAQSVTVPDYKVINLK